MARPAVFEVLLKKGEKIGDGPASEPLWGLVYCGDDSHSLQKRAGGVTGGSSGGLEHRAVRPQSCQHEVIYGPLRRSVEG